MMAYGQDGGASGSHHGEKVWVASHLKAEQCARAIGPVVAESSTAAAAYVDAHQGTRHCVEARSEDDDVHVEVSLSSTNSGGCRALDTAFAEIHERDI